MNELNKKPENLLLLSQLCCERIFVSSFQLAAKHCTAQLYIQRSGFKMASLYENIESRRQELSWLLHSPLKIRTESKYERRKKIYLINQSQSAKKLFELVFMLQLNRYLRRRLQMKQVGQQKKMFFFPL